MTGVNTSFENAVNCYRQAYRIVNKADMDTKSAFKADRSVEIAEARSNMEKELNRLKGNYGKAVQNNGGLRRDGFLEQNGANGASDIAKSQKGRVNGKRYDGFASYFIAGDKSDKTDKPANTDRADFCLIDEDDRKKAQELRDAYEYFRRAARSNGYTVVRSGSDKSISYTLMSGKKSVIMIDPEFMDSIRDDPEALKKYADEIETMKRLDKQFERRAKQQGKTVVSRGWKIEKDGSISSWSVVKTERKASKGHLERMRELQEKIRKKKTKKKKEAAQLEEKRSKRKEERLRLEGKKKSAMRENLKRKTKKVRIYDMNYIRPKTNPNKKITSVSISCGSSPSLLDKKV